MKDQNFFSSEVSIGNCSVSATQPSFIIAEAGVNHNGNLEMAKRLILEAKNSGADCVKFQTFKTERIITQGAPKANYQLKTTNPQESQFEMLKLLELSESDHYELFSLAQEVGILCISTPYNVEDIEFLVACGVPALKIASGQIIEPDFLQSAAETKLPVILSTGMATLQEIASALDVFKKSNNPNLILLQCTTNYPSRIEDTHLRVIETFHRSFGCISGYSDHTEGNLIAIASVAMGASVVEKHFTLDRNLPGPDHACSSNPQEFKELVAGIRLIEKAMGSPFKHPTDVEIQNAQGMRRSLVAKMDIPSQTNVSTEMFTCKRPGIGLPPTMLHYITGLKSRHAIAKDTLISFRDFE